MKRVGTVATAFVICIWLGFSIAIVWMYCVNALTGISAIQLIFKVSLIWVLVWCGIWITSNIESKKDNDIYDVSEMD